MLSFLQYLLALLITARTPLLPGAPAPAPDVTGMVLTVSAFGLAWTTWGLLGARRAAAAGDAAVEPFLRTVSLGRITALGAFWILTQTLHGKALPHALGVDGWVLVPHLLRLLPFALLLALLRAGLHPIGARLGLEPPGLLATLRLEFQQALVPVAPLLPLLVAWDVIFQAAPTTALGAMAYVLTRVPLAQALLSLGMLFLALLLTPFVLRRAWNAVPLPAGPLRARLEAYASSVGLRSREILVWPTGGEYMNAAVVGAFPRFRYVFLSDALVEGLGHDEIEAVFAHEAGHARRGHVLLFFGFTAVIVLAGLVPEALGARGDPLAGVDPFVRSVGMILLWLGVIFGWVSRRFEQEADVFGIDTVAFAPAADGSPRDPAEHPFPRALERIADEAGGIREITGWRHFSIADRVAFVRDYLTDAAVRARYRRSIRLLRGTIISVVVAFLALVAADVPKALGTTTNAWETARDPAAALLGPLAVATSPVHPVVRAEELVSAASLAQAVGDDARALRWLRAAASLAPRAPVVLDAYARALHGAERPLGAALVWEQILGLEDVRADIRERAEAGARTPAPAAPRAGAGAGASPGD